MPYANVDPKNKKQKSCKGGHGHLHASCLNSGFNKFILSIFFLEDATMYLPPKLWKGHELISTHKRNVVVL